MSISSSANEFNARGEIRRGARDRRRSQPEKDSVSVAIINRLRQLPEFIVARTVAAYLDVRDEVRTREALPGMIAAKSCVALPWCDGDQLRLCQVESLADLEPGRFGIEEPKRTIRELDARSISIRDVELVIVPGVAFDAQCGRLGHGQGYYDRLLADATESTFICGIAFDSQIVPAIPLEPHDIRMDVVVTESRVYRHDSQFLSLRF